MKTISRFSLAFILALNSVLVSSPQAAFAISSNPGAACANNTCTVTFNYSGDYYRWSAPLSGLFTLEVWGAEGGGIPGDTNWGTGGKGGYAKGFVELNNGDNLFIYPGQKGSMYSGTTMNFNGGGFGNPGYSQGGYSGGGATHIATSIGLLESLTAQSSSVLIVAGGGGGAGGTRYSTYQYPENKSNGGAGGGTTGSSGTSIVGGVGGTGGTQNSRGTSIDPSTQASFGRGANASTSQSSSPYVVSGGGGGGWYGGGAGQSSGGGGGGGSGYVGNLISSELISGSSSMPNPTGGMMTGRSGDGLVRITYDTVPASKVFSSNTSEQDSFDELSRIEYSLIISQSVADLATSDFQFGGTSSCATIELSGSGYSYTIAVSGCSPGNLILQLKSNSVTGSGTGPSANQSSNTLSIRARSNLSIQISGGVTSVQKGISIDIVASADQAGKVTIYVDGKRLPGCVNKRVNAGNSSCPWRPTVRKAVQLSARLVPTDSAYLSASASLSAAVVTRTVPR